jgi:XTP/dITP diphosphohydrolase
MVRALTEPRIVLATHNAGKLKEFSGLVAPFAIKIVSAGELGLPEPEETGETFEANAATKALLAARASGLPALSDDSGLEVDALGNAPGVYTADWATKDDGTRDFHMAMRMVEDALQGIGAVLPAQRTGRFVATLCLAWPDGETQFFRGEAPGRLIWPPRGDDGFGYDPVFLPDGQSRTFGEMSADEKHGWAPGQAHALSHRARAFRLFAEAHLMARLKAVKT